MAKDIQASKGTVNRILPTRLRKEGAFRSLIFFENKIKHFLAVVESYQLLQRSPTDDFAVAAEIEPEIEQQLRNLRRDRISNLKVIFHIDSSRDVEWGILFRFEDRPNVFEHARHEREEELGLVVGHFVFVCTKAD